jgi:hypothetical protein
VFSVPGLVLPRDDLIPRHGSQPGDAGRPGFQSLPVFLAIRTPDLDLNGGHSMIQGHIDQGISGELNPIDRIRNDGSSNTNIIFGEALQALT